MGHGEISIWSQEQMYKFVDRLLLGSWTEKEFRNRTRMKYMHEALKIYN